jgi:hypothetical protein
MLTMKRHTGNADYEAVYIDIPRNYAVGAKGEK